LLLKLSHFFDFVEIYDVACFHVVQVLDAFTTKDRRVLAAVEMFDPLLVLMAEVWLEVCLIIFIVFIDFRS
jgi:hypothetical protein